MVKKFKLFDNRDKPRIRGAGAHKKLQNKFGKNSVNKLDIKVVVSEKAT